jgi:hypothetical protein
MRHTTAYRGELLQSHPKFPKGSAAALMSHDESEREESGSKLDLPNIVYSQEDNDAIEHFIRENLNTTWHSMGTAKMASSEVGGVVDTKLNVYGVVGPTVPVSSFYDISKLDAFELGMLGNNEAFILGNAIRQSTLKTVHIRASDPVSSHNDNGTLDLFFSGLVSSPEAINAHSYHPEEINCGFPPSIIELAIEDDHQT